MVVEEYTYLVMEFNQRNDKQKREFLKTLMDNSMKDGITSCMNIINDVEIISPHEEELCKYRDGLKALFIREKLNIIAKENENAPKEDSE